MTILIDKSRDSSEDLTVCNMMDMGDMALPHL
jgi:hypothetical protein